MIFFTQHTHSHPRSVGRRNTTYTHIPPSAVLSIVSTLPSVPFVPLTLPPPSSSLLSLSLSVVGCWLSSSSVVYILFAHLCISISHLPHYPDLTAWPCHRPLNPVLISLMSSLPYYTLILFGFFFFPFLFFFSCVSRFLHFLFLFFT